MKRLLHFYLPVTIIFVSLTIFGLLFLNRTPHLPLYALNMTRLHSSPVAARVIFDGTEYPGIKVYPLEEYRQPGEGRQFLVYAHGVWGMDRVTIVDIDARDIGHTNSGEPYFKMYFDRYLIQTDDAYAVIYASDKVKWGYDPRMTVAQNKVTYFNENLLGQHKIEIIFEENL